jgi:hypothetical protein
MTPRMAGLARNATAIVSAATPTAGNAKTATAGSENTHPTQSAMPSEPPKLSAA